MRDNFVHLDPADVSSISEVLPYEPTLSSWHPQQTDVFLCNYQGHPAHEIPTYNSDYHIIPLWKFGTPAIVEARMDGKRMSPTEFGHGESGLIPAGVNHWGVWDRPVDITVMFVSTQFLDRISRNLLKQDRLELIPQHNTADRSLYHLGMAIEQDVIEGKSMGTIYTQSLLTAFAMRLLKNHSTTSVDPYTFDLSIPNPRIELVTQYINDNLDRDLQLIDLAVISGYTEDYLSRLFKKSIGTSLYQYIIQQRIHRAQELLHHRNLTFQDIAKRCGFHTHTNLTRHFKRIVGITPTAARATIYSHKDLALIQ